MTERAMRAARGAVLKQKEGVLFPKKSKSTLRLLDDDFTAPSSDKISGARYTGPSGENNQLDRFLDGSCVLVQTHASNSVSVTQPFRECSVGDVISQRLPKRIQFPYLSACQLFLVNAGSTFSSPRHRRFSHV